MFSEQRLPFYTWVEFELFIIWWYVFRATNQNQNLCAHNYRKSVDFLVFVGRRWEIKHTHAHTFDKIPEPKWKLCEQSETAVQQQWLRRMCRPKIMFWIIRCERATSANGPYAISIRAIDTHVYAATHRTTESRKKQIRMYGRKTLAIWMERRKKRMWNKFSRQSDCLTRFLCLSSVRLRHAYIMLHAYVTMATTLTRWENWNEPWINPTVCVCTRIRRQFMKLKMCTVKNYFICWSGNQGIGKSTIQPRFWFRFARVSHASDKMKCDVCWTQATKPVQFVKLNELISFKCLENPSNIGEKILAGWFPA